MGHFKLHADEHVNGTDDIRDATASQKGLATAAQITKLDGIEAGATKSTYAEQAELIYISDSKGHDVNGDGSLFNPFKTLQKAITWGASVYDTFDIFLSSEFPGAAVTIPGNKNIRFFSYPNYEIATITMTLTGNDNKLYFQNITVEIDMDSHTGFDVSMESGKLSSLTNGTPDLLEFKGTRMTQATWNAVKSIATGYGLVVDPTPANNRVVIFQNTDINGKKIINMANGVAATDAATIGQLPVSPSITFADQQDIYYVSGAKGDTIANGADGSQFNPLSTINEAISLGVTAALDHIAILVDYYDNGYDATIPDNKNVSIFCMELFNSDAYINTIILGDSCWVEVANIYVELIKEASGISDTSINLANVFAAKLSDFAETGYATNTNLYSNNTWFNTPAEALNAKSFTGTIIDGSGIFMPLNGLDLSGNQINDIGDGTLAQDAAAFGQIGSAITTHAGLPSVHHAKYLDSEAISAMGAKADGNPLNHDRPVQATESIVGIAEMATQPETDAGTDDEKIVTPLKLKTSKLIKKTQPFGFDALGSGSTSYLKHGSIIFLGTDKEGTPTKIYVNAYKIGGTTYNIRIQDITNGNTIAEVTGLSNTTEGIQDLGTISNLPTGQARWELQLQRVGVPPGNIVSSGGLIEW